MGKRRSIFEESILLSLFSVTLQVLGLLFNVFLTKHLGAASVGVLTLMGSFYSLAAVLSGGSGFLATSRFISEEIGCCGNPHRVFVYLLRFCLLLSISSTVLLILTAPLTASLISGKGVMPSAVRVLCLSLPLSALNACLKGRCYAYHRVYVPAIAECAEFILRSGMMAFCTVFLIPQGHITLLTAFSLSMLAGQGIALLFLMTIRFPNIQKAGRCMPFIQFLRLLLPMIGNASLVALLSSVNDALVPLTLLQYGQSPHEALAQFGSFEAIILPTLFFPSVYQCCMSGLLVPDLSRARSVGDIKAVRQMTERVLEQTVEYALPFVLILALFGRQIGLLLGGDAFTGTVLCCMAPVVPLIYLEIIMEAVLRGLGKQSISSLVYIVEYLVRISVLLVCVPLFGFYGIVVSYMACNLTGNSVRLFFVLRLTGLRPFWSRLILRPAFSLLLSWQLTALLMLLIRRFLSNRLMQIVLFGTVCVAIYLFTLRAAACLSDSKSTEDGNRYKSFSALF